MAGVDANSERDYTRHIGKELTRLRAVREFPNVLVGLQVICCHSP